MRTRIGACVLMLSGVAMAATDEARVAPPPLEHFLRHSQYVDVKISPGGEYLAVSALATESTSAIAILRRADLTAVGGTRLGDGLIVNRLEWVGDKRIVFSVSSYDDGGFEPRPSGMLFAMDWNGKSVDYLTERSPIRNLVGTLKNDDKHVLVTLFGDKDKPGVSGSLGSLNVFTKFVDELTQAPVASPVFLLDDQGQPRFATGFREGDDQRVYYRGEGEKAWRKISDETAGDARIHPVGFMADGERALIMAEQAEGPDALQAWDPRTGKRTLVDRHEHVDPRSFVYDQDRARIVGVVYLDGAPQARLLDAKSRMARRWKALTASFPGQWVDFRSYTRDGSELIFRVVSDRNPGEFYLLDRDDKATFLFAARSWIDPSRMAETKPIHLAARDGLTLHGFLTLPPESSGERLPMIVFAGDNRPDQSAQWFHDSRVQLLASRGYAVLQVNPRGSGNYGRSFVRAGDHQWGGKVIDDFADGARWAIAQGTADPRRICIYGMGVGGYIAAQSLAREPTLYRCGVGQNGIYDLPLLLAEKEIAESENSVKQIKRVFGEESETLIDASPARHAERIKSPLFLLSADDDPHHSAPQDQAMRAALEKAGAVVEAVEIDVPHRKHLTDAEWLAVYPRVLAWFDRYIGPSSTATAANH